jgi:hypothetical protein
MSQNLVVGPINKGQQTDRLPFNIDKDSFPILLNAYQWRGRVKRKRGTSKLNRLLRSINTSTIQTDGAGHFDGNLLTGLETNATLANTQITIGADIFTLSNTSTGALTGSTGGSGTINFSTGALTITGAPALTNIQFNYYPSLPVMGLEDLNLISTQFSSNLAFDTKYSYNISPLFPYLIYDVSFYKNLPTGSYPAYVQKNPTSSATPLTWNGANYQQFWSTNYEGAFWVTNGIKITNGFADLTSIGMQFANAASITYVANTATTLTVNILNGPLVVGDFVYANEWTANKGLNNQTGYVTTATPNTPGPGSEQVIITFPNATIGAGPLTPGILQYLTNRSDVTKDNIRWYDGDPTTGVLPQVLQPGLGWVNFMPPLSNLNYSIADTPQAIYYLVGCKLLLPYKDRLLCFGPVIQTSTGGPIYLQDTVIYSQNGTPYYTNSYTNNPLAAVDNPTGPFYTNLISLLVPINQTATPSSWFEDSTGFGGFRSAGIAQPINLASLNQDVMMIEFDRSVSRLVYSGDDISPFDFYETNAEYGCGSTFSGINMDAHILSRGKRGFIAASQSSVTRFDLDIPDSAFEINLRNNGSERVTAVRDFINEWIYFTYCSGQSALTYPNQTLFYNYRDESWGIFNETYTTYGLFRPQTGFTWATLPVESWNTWNDPWNSGSDNLFQTQVIAGNQQGFVVIREDELTSEAPSLYIDNIAGNVIICRSHNLKTGDYIVIKEMTGTAGLIFNGKVFQVTFLTNDSLIIDTSSAGSTYFGLGTITRVYNPFIQTKQFNEGWSLARKTRIGPQQYLLTKTNNSQITLQIYLSQDSANVWNAGTIVPDQNALNSGLIYSQVLYTCPESTNLGLTPANTNLQMLVGPGSAANTPASSKSYQIFHRVNTSLIGDSIQFGFTMSDAQLLDKTLQNQFAEIELHGFIVDISASGFLA